MLCEHIKGSRRQQWPSKSRPGQEQPQNLWLLILIWECKRALTLTPTVIPPAICSILHSFHPLFLLLFTKHFCSSLPRLLGHWLTRHSSRTDASSQIVWMLKPPSTLYIVKHSQWTGKKHLHSVFWRRILLQLDLLSFYFNLSFFILSCISTVIMMNVFFKHEQSLK